MVRVQVCQENDVDSLSVNALGPHVVEQLPAGIGLHSGVNEDELALGAKRYGTVTGLYLIILIQDVGELPPSLHVAVGKGLRRRPLDGEAVQYGHLLDVAYGKPVVRHLSPPSLVSTMLAMPESECPPILPGLDERGNACSRGKNLYRDDAPMSAASPPIPLVPMYRLVRHPSMPFRHTSKNNLTGGGGPVR